MTIIRYLIPYSAKAIAVLHKIEKKYKAKWTVDANEIVTITVKARHAEKIKDLIKEVIK